jgi:hypothetical protein
MHFSGSPSTGAPFRAFRISVGCGATWMIALSPLTFE